MALSCTIQSGAMYLDTHVIIFFTITSLDKEGITNIVAPASVHVVMEGRNNGSYIDFMEPFSYSQMVRWYINIGFGNGSYICIITIYVSPRSTMDIYDAIFYCA